MSASLAERLISHRAASSRHTATFTQLQTPGASSACLPHARRSCARDVKAAGILDSYRREQGLAVAEPRSPPKQQAAEPDEEEGVCSAECVREVFSAQQFDHAVNDAAPQTLVVVDFYRTACGSCKYISAGFLKLCKGSHDEHEPVEFLKHNVFDEAEQFTDLGDRLRIKVVPSFYFYKGGELVDHFATRDKKRIAEAINKHVGKEVADGQPIY